MDLKFKEVPAKGPVSTSEEWYDMTNGGYIRPEEMLEEPDATKVKEAIALIIKFLDEAEESGHLEFQ